MVYEQWPNSTVTLAEVAIPNGTLYRSRPADGTLGPRYVYSLTDHLGNVRAVVPRGWNPTATPPPGQEWIRRLSFFSDYYPYGWSQPGRDMGLYRYGFQGQEKDPETDWWAFQLRMYDGRVGRWMTYDPKKQFANPYLGLGNNPFNGIDPDGGSFLNWYKNDLTGEVSWIEGSGPREGFTDLGADALSPAVFQAISQHISSVGSACPEQGFETFISYFKNQRLGKDYFFNVANTFQVRSSGWLGSLIDNSQAVRDAFHISEWTHALIANPNSISNSNALEHHIGSFLIAERHGFSLSLTLTTLNEIRGLVINDVQSGRVLDALLGRGGTAFEYRDLYHNQVGLHLHSQYRYSISPVKIPHTFKY